MHRVHLFFVLLMGCTVIGACRRDDPPQPARIISGSMAERYYGEHWRVTCGECGCAYFCGVEHPPDDMLAICPNCGYRENKVDAQAKQPGMGVEVVPRDFVKNPPRRWEVVAYREADSDRVAVKRVVGLPGEKLAIRGGDLFVDEMRVQKSLAEFRDVAQRVNDDLHRPMRTPDLPARWRAASVESRWTESSGFARGYRHTRGETAAFVDWLEYHHWSCAATPTPRTADAPIRDNDSYNQSLSRAMNAVGDVALSFTVENVSEGDELGVRLYGGDDPLVVWLSPKFDEVKLVHRSIVLAETKSSLPLIVTAAMIDGRVLVEIGGRPMLKCDLDAAAIELDPHEVSLAIGSHNVNLELTNLRVLRDVYYLNPHGRPDDWEMAAPLGKNEYFLLGDNPPLSRDSRQDGSVAVERMVGSVRPRSD